MVQNCHRQILNIYQFQKYKLLANTLDKKFYHTSLVAETSRHRGGNDCTLRQYSYYFHGIWAQAVRILWWSKFFDITRVNTYRRNFSWQPINRRFERINICDLRVNIILRLFSYDEIIIISTTINYVISLSTIYLSEAPSTANANTPIRKRFFSSYHPIYSDWS